MKNTLQKHYKKTFWLLVALFITLLSFAFVLSKNETAMADDNVYRYTDAFTGSYSSISFNESGLNAKLSYQMTDVASRHLSDNYLSTPPYTRNIFRAYFFNEDNYSRMSSALSNYLNNDNYFVYDESIELTNMQSNTVSFYSSSAKHYNYDYIAIHYVYSNSKSITSYSKIFPLKKSTQIQEQADRVVQQRLNGLEYNYNYVISLVKNALPFTSYGYQTENKAGNVIVNYKGYGENGKIQNLSTTFAVDDKNLLRNKDIAKYHLLKTDFSQLSDFNVVTKALTDAGAGYILNDKTTVQEAIDIEVNLNNFNSPVINIVYDLITANDIAFTVSSNDDELAELNIDVYCGNIESNGQTGTITFEYEDIETICASSVNWIFDISDNLENIQVTTDSDTRVEVNNDCLIVYYNLNNQDSLLNLNISFVGEVHEARLYDVTLNYTEFKMVNNNVVETPRSLDFVAYDVAIRNACAIPSNILTGVGTDTAGLFYFRACGDVINNAIQSSLKDLDYCYFIDANLSRPEKYTTDAEEIATKVANGQTVGSYSITVEYGYHPIFKIETQGLNLTTNIRFEKTPFNVNRTLKGTYFVKSVPNGYRVESISIPREYLNQSTQDNENYTLSTFEFTPGYNDKMIIPVTVNFSNKVIVKFEYFERYFSSKGVKTPFAKKVPFQTTVLFSRFDNAVNNIDGYDLNDLFADLIVEQDATKEDKIEEGLAFLGLVHPDLTSSNFSMIMPISGVYEINLPYTCTTLRHRNDEGGNLLQVPVSMTRYTDWVKTFGNADWKLTMLNRGGNEPNYFDYNDETLLENIYGLFGDFMYEEKQGDLNYYFAKEAGVGYVNMIDIKEFKGSEFYKKFSEHKEEIASISGLTTAMITAGVTGLKFGLIKGAICGIAIGGATYLLANFGVPLASEIANDENEVQFHHFFYLDGTSGNPYHSRTGSDDIQDKDSASTNKGQEILKNIKENKITAWIIFAVGVFVGAIALYFGLKLAGLGTSLGGILGKIFVLIILIALGVGGFFYARLVIDLIAGAGGL